MNKIVSPGFKITTWKSGDRIWDTIDHAIRLRDKLLLVLSEQSIRSDWVRDEVETALEEERKRQETGLFLVRLDRAVMETRQPWAGKVRQRHIGDFEQWKKHDSYHLNFVQAKHIFGEL